MKAVRLYGPRDLRQEDLPMPSPQAGEVVCRVERCGVCGTDYSIFSGNYSFIEKGMVKFPMTLGHEWAGKVEQVGLGVEFFKIGDRVVGDTVVSCGQCYDCLMGRYYYCKKLRCVGTIYTWDGAYAEYILMPARHLFALPENVNLDNGALVEPAATGLYSVIQAGIELGDNVLVQGAGPIGITAAKFAKLCGATKVMIIDRKKFNLQQALSLGVDIAINTAEISVSEAVKHNFGQKGPNRIIEASGSLELLKESLKCISPGGTISVVAMYDQVMKGFDVDEFVCKNITIRAVVGSWGTYKKVLELMSSGIVDFTSLITSRYKLSEVKKAMEEMENDNKRIKIMLEPNL